MAKHQWQDHGWLLQIEQDSPDRKDVSIHAKKIKGRRVGATQPLANSCWHWIGEFVQASQEIGCGIALSLFGFNQLLRHDGF